MKENDKKELNLEQLETVTGGTREQSKDLHVIFNGGDIWGEGPTILEAAYAQLRVTQRTGFVVKCGELNSNGEYELIYEAPDGTIYSHYEFLDYLKANYTVEYLLGMETE